MGKLDPDALATLLAATGADDPAVLQGAAYGEDAAAIDLGDETLVVSADPVSLAAERAGQLGVHVACNDVAASGADPRWLTNTVFLPDDDPETLESLATQVDETAAEVGVAVVGGHSEYLPQLDRPLLSLSAFGLTDRFVPAGGAAPGDRILLTKGAGLEATAILATDFADDLREAGVSTTTIEAAAGFFSEVSVVDDAAALREHASAMHDPTEGGVLAALHEMATAAGVAAHVAREDVPVRPETTACCAAMEVDPLRSFGSGALLATVPAERVDDALGALEAAGIRGGVVGEVRATGGDAPGVVLDGERIASSPRDDMYALWE